MANLKKVLAGSLSLCLAASMFTACGNTDSSSTSDKNGGSTSKAGNNTGINNSSDRVNTAELHGVDSSEDSKKTLTIYCWNTEFKSRLDKYYIHRAHQTSLHTTSLLMVLRRSQLSTALS